MGRVAKPVLLVAAVSVVLVVAAVIAVVLTRGPGPSPATLTVTGTGQVSATPDTLTLDVGVSTSAATAAAALAENDATMQKVVAAFRRAGVPPSGLQTSDLEVSPNYDESGDVNGYGADDDLTVTLHDLRHAGSVIDAGARAAGNAVQISGVSFSISDTSSLMVRARVAAVQAAHREAVALARGAGAPLGGLERLTDEEQQTPPPILPMYASGAARAARPSVPVQSGNEQVSVQVQAVYALGG